jgi:putative Holliday junction resolvase
MQDSSKSLMALDIGEARIGVAMANMIAKLPNPLTTIKNDDSVFDTIGSLLSKHDAAAIVVGLPRGMDSQNTSQTRSVEEFVNKLRAHTELPIYWQDEALTSKKAEAELNAKGKPYSKEDIDSLAATYILEDFISSQLKEINR